ncbi:hypothetical protein [Hyphomicrobium sp.]|uniref:hypothetical protein n=1 Tax=Hyphomicrobium sp. TaxID=82 RepID=UPI000FA171F7|nr:hypothetical protein [Hyphomicrobium sp.]RUP00334.1 MAG: hypothetical protein EKK30_01875 [Hyphomicrobium sp.]
MKRPRRSDPSAGSEIAMMAVITKAMGAFLVLVVLLMPYYVVNINIEGLTKNVQEKMDKVQSQSSETLKNVKEALQRAGKGRLTDREIDELQAQIKQLETDLAEARTEVERLNSKVKQQASQIARLQKEIEDLKQEIERLKRNQGDPPLVISQLTWSGCVGTRFVPLMRLTGADGSTSAPITLTSNLPFQTAQSTWKLDDDGGVSRASLPIGDGQKTTDVFFLRLNGVPGDHSTCHVKAEVHVKNLVHPLGTFDVQDETVGFVGRVKTTANSIEPGQVEGAEVEKDLSALKASDCEDLTCFSKDKPGSETDVDRAFASYLVKAKVPEDVAKELASAVAANRMTPAAAFRWGQLVLDLKDAPTGNAGMESGEFSGLLEEKGAPPTVRTQAQEHAYSDETTLSAAVKKMKDWPDALDPALYPIAEGLRNQGMPPELANKFARAIDNKVVSEDEAKMWADLLKKANVSGPVKYDTTKLAILQTPKVSGARVGVAVPLAAALAKAVNDGQTTREQVLGLLGAAVQSAPSKPQFNAVQPPPSSQPAANSNGRVDATLGPLVASGAISDSAAAAWTKVIAQGRQDKEIKLMAAKSAIEGSMKLPAALVELLARQYSEGALTMEQIKQVYGEMQK